MDYSQIVGSLIATKKINDERQRALTGAGEEDLFYETYGKTLSPVRAIRWIGVASSWLLRSWQWVPAKTGEQVFRDKNQRSDRPNTATFASELCHLPRSGFVTPSATTPLHSE